VLNDVDDEFLDGTRAFITYMRPRLKMYAKLITGNIIFKKRVTGIGIIDAEMCRKYGATGPLIRAAGVAYDVRRAEPYSAYPDFDFEIPTFPEGDSMARYRVRMAEMEQSLRILEQALGKLPDGPFITPNVPKLIKPPPGDTCFATEAARGRFMVRVVSNGTNTPYRMRLRTPCFANMSVFEEASQGMMLADALAVLGSLDMVIPDIDR